MEKRFGFKLFIYFLSGSFLLMMSGFPAIVAQAKEGLLPIGEMVSKGEVKFEARENVWKDVESSHFSIFQGTRIKTDKGLAYVTLSDDSQIEVGSKSLFFLDEDSRFVLSQGSIQFRIPSGSETSFRVGNLSVVKSRTLQAGKGLSSALPAEEETVGTITVNANGSATVRSLRGKVTLMNKERVVLAALSSKDTITIPSTTVGGKPPVMVAQVGEVAAGAGGGTIFGMAGTTVLFVAGGIVGLGASVWAVSEATKDDHDEAPACP
ncbi:MAG: hypothetical protein ACE144_20095 [Thermodesulfobacteriota bacterium]